MFLRIYERSISDENTRIEPTMLIHKMQHTFPHHGLNRTTRLGGTLVVGLYLGRKVVNVHSRSRLAENRGISEKQAKCAHKNYEMVGNRKVNAINRWGRYLREWTEQGYRDTR